MKRTFRLLRRPIASGGRRSGGRRAFLHQIDFGAVDLVQVGQLVAGSEVVEDGPEVPGDVLRVVLPLERQVQRVEGHGTCPAVPVGEGQVGGAVR